MRWPKYLVAIAATATISIAADLPASPTSLSIKVRSVPVRSQPKYWGSSVVTVKYGDSVTQISGDGGWLKVKTKSGATGYIHESAVTTKRIVLAANQQAVSSFSDKSEIVLAGKGFNLEAEKGLKATDATLNFSAVDSIERIRVSNSELGNFIRAGKLQG